MSQWSSREEYDDVQLHTQPIGDDILSHHEQHYHDQQQQQQQQHYEGDDHDDDETQKLKLYESETETRDPREEHVHDRPYRPRAPVPKTVDRRSSASNTTIAAVAGVNRGGDDIGARRETEVVEDYSHTIRVQQQQQQQPGRKPNRPPFSAAATPASSNTPAKTPAPTTKKKFYDQAWFLIMVGLLIIALVCGGAWVAMKHSEKSHVSTSGRIGSGSKSSGGHSSSHRRYIQTELLGVGSRIE